MIKENGINKNKIKFGIYFIQLKIKLNNLLSIKYNLLKWL